MKTTTTLMLSILLWAGTSLGQQAESTLKLGLPGKKSVNSFSMPYSFSDLVAHGISIRTSSSEEFSDVREISWELERVSIFKNLDSIGHGEGWVPFVGNDMGVGFLPLKIKVTASDFSEEESKEITGLVQTALGRLFGVIGEDSQYNHDLFMDISILELSKERLRNNFSGDFQEIDMFNFIALNLQKTITTVNIGSSHWQLYVRGEGNVGSTRRIVLDNDAMTDGSHLNLTGCGGFDFAKSSYRVAGEICYERKKNENNDIEIANSSTYRTSLVGTHTQSPIELRVGYENKELENGLEDKRMFVEAKYHLK